MSLKKLLSPLTFENVPKLLYWVECTRVGRQEPLVNSICKQLFHLMRVVHGCVIHIHTSNSSNLSNKLFAETSKYLSIITATDKLIMNKSAITDTCYQSV